MRQPSHYQQAIYDAYPGAERPIAVEAVSGSGKTTVLEEALPLRPSHYAAYFAFNRHTVEQARARLTMPGLSIQTIHSAGFAALRAASTTKWTIDDKKYLNLCRSFVTHNAWSWRDSKYSRPWDAIIDLNKLVTFARLTLTPADDIDTFGVEAVTAGLMAPAELYANVTRILWEGAKTAEDQGVIDFTDMLVLPVRWDLDFPKYDVVCVDELQDLSAAQLEVVLRSRAPKAVGLLCGDRFQSVMGFAHAGGMVYDDAITATNATSMPLSICYRCPTSHLDLARQLVPHIEARPDAPMGEIRYADDIVSAAPQPGDMVLCRNTAPLVEACLALLRAKVPARVRGRDLGSDIAATLRAASRSNDIAQLPSDLIHYLEDARGRLEEQGAPEGQFAALNDRVDSAFAAHHGLMPCHSVAELVAKVQGIFTDTEGGVMLSTVHRAKGLEAENVHILRPDLLTSTTQEEANIQYVALTRAKHTLTFIQPPEADE